MIDYIKIFKDTINKNFETLAAEAREKHPRVYSKQDTQDTATFGLSISKENEDNLPWVEGQAFAYTCKLADLLQNYKIKSIDIKLYRPEDDRPDIVPPYSETLLVGRIELTR